MNAFRASSLSSRLLAGFGAAALLGGLGLASSRPAHTAGGPIAVSVSNVPLSTTASDDHDKQAVQFETSAHFPDGNGGSSFPNYVYTVPVGKRLVIETVTASSSFKDTDRYNIFLRSGGGIGKSYDVSDNTVRSQINLLSDGTLYPSVTAHLHQCADGGTQVNLYAYRTRSVGDVLLGFVVTGYFVDMP